MEQYSQVDKGNIGKNVIEGQLRECFGRVVYSHKTHEKCVDILLSRLSIIKIGQIILSALSTGGFLAVLFGEDIKAGIAGVIVSTLLLILNAYTKDYDLGELAQKHKQAANELWIIREKYLSLLTDLNLQNKDIESIRAQRDELLEQLHAVYIGAPSTISKAYKKAQIALQKAEDMSFSVKEIDSFLPKELKRG